MSYMKNGRAQKWAARVFRWESLEENMNQTRFLDWEDFQNEFRKEFTLHTPTPLLSIDLSPQPTIKEIDL